MLELEIVRRPANVAARVALEGLLKKFPTAEVVSFTKDSKTNEYVAKLKTAEFPPQKEESDTEPEADASSDEDAESGPPVDDSEGDSSGESAPEKPKKESPDTMIVHLLTEILHALQGGSPVGGPDDMDAMSEIGAPDQHEQLPPPPKAPLPGPATKHNMPGMGSPAFAARRTFVAEREDAHEVTAEQAEAEANGHYAAHGFKVAKVVKDYEKNIYRVALVRA